MLLAATFGQDLAEVFPDGGVILLLIFDCRFDQIGEGLDELRSRRVLGRSCLLKCLFCSHLDGRHAFEEHFDEIVARAHLGLVNEASYQRQAFGWSVILEFAGVQGTSFRCEMFDDRWRNILEERFHRSQLHEPIQPVLPGFQVRKRWALRNQLELGERRAMQWRLHFQESFDGVLDLGSHSGIDYPEDMPLDKCANPSHQAVQRAERR